MSLWEYIYPTFKFEPNHKVRLFEAFSGIGCQAMALKRVTDNYELVGFSEIDKYAIQSYRAIHGDVNNYGDITKMETIPSCDIFTYSFPCVDLSKAGKQKGMSENTRSGLVYEVLRLLKATSDKPKILIMENVPDLIQCKFVKQFNEIQFELEQLGYRNYNEVLNAKDFGIPQNRERVFMVSILGDYSYDFPDKIKLQLLYKDLLENPPNEKYFLSKGMLSCLIKLGEKAKLSGLTYEFNPVDIDDCKISMCISARDGERLPSNYIRMKDGRIRRLSHLEQWRLMGVSDSDFIKATTPYIPNGKLTSQAGNGIVVNVFEAILKQLF